MSGVNHVWYLYKRRYNYASTDIDSYSLLCTAEQRGYAGYVGRPRSSWQPAKYPTCFDCISKRDSYAHDVLDEFSWRYARCRD